MISNVNIKIFLTIVLFIIGGYYIQYSVNNGLIKADIETLQVNADYVGSGSSGSGGSGSSGSGGK